MNRMVKAKQASRQALGIPEKNTEVIPVKVGPNLKEAVTLASGGNVSGWVRGLIKRELKRRYRL